MVVSASSPVIDVIDETFVVAPVAALEAQLCDESRWRALGYDVSCYDDRGVEGRRWRLDGALHGTCEVWLEQAHGGVVVHLYVRADPTSGTRSWPRLARRWVHPLKAWVLEVKAEHDRRRPAGVPGPGRPKDAAGVPGPGRLGTGPAGTSPAGTGRPAPRSTMSPDIEEEG